jgi:hypothetical protein
MESWCVVRYSLQIRSKDQTTQRLVGRFDDLKHGAVFPQSQIDQGEEKLMRCAAVWDPDNEIGVGGLGTFDTTETPLDGFGFRLTPLDENGLEVRFSSPSC